MKTYLFGRRIADHGKVFAIPTSWTMWHTVDNDWPDDGLDNLTSAYNTSHEFKLVLAYHKYKVTDELRKEDE